MRYVWNDSRDADECGELNEWCQCCKVLRIFVDRWGEVCGWRDVLSLMDFLYRIREPKGWAAEQIYISAYKSSMTTDHNCLGTLLTAPKDQKTELNYNYSWEGESWDVIWGVVVSMSTRELCSRVIHSRLLSGNWRGTFWPSENVLTLMQLSIIKHNLREEYKGLIALRSILVIMSCVVVRA